MQYPNFLQKIDKKKSIFVSLILSFIFISALYAGGLIGPDQAKAANVVWDGNTDTDGGDGVTWSDPLNWSTNAVPGDTDIAVFNTTYTGSVNVDIDPDVSGIVIESGYTGTMTQGLLLLGVGDDGFTMAGGTFVGGINSIDVRGPFLLTGGTFTTTSNQLRFYGDVTIGSGATFNHNSATVVFTGTTNQDVDVDTSWNLHNLTIGSFTVPNVTLASDNTIVLTGNLILGNGEFDGGTIETPGSVSVTGGDGGTGIIHMTGTAAQTISLSSGFATRRFPGLILDNPNVTFDGTDHNYFEGAVTLNAGLIDGSAAEEWDFEQGLTIAGGTYDAAPVTDVGLDWTQTSGTFNHNNGTVYLVDEGISNDSSHTISGTTTFYNLKMERPYYTASVEFSNTGSFTVLNDATFTMGYKSLRAIDERVTISSTSAGNAANIDFQGRVNMFHPAIQDINNTGTEFDCRVRCVDNGNNTGIDFGPMSVINVSEISNETTEAGGNATFSVVLMGRPTSNVIIPVASSDITEGILSIGSLTFTNANWYIPQTVTVTGEDDFEDDGTTAYTIQLGLTTSSDTRFNGLNPDDVSVNNQDDDTDSGKLDFEVLSDLDLEDIRGTSGSNVGAFWDEGNARISLWDNDTDWNDLDADGTKIMPGCKITLEGTTYDILQVVDEGEYGYDMTLTRSGLSKYEVYDEISSYADYDIDSITCFEAADGGVKLNDNFITVEGVTSIGEMSDIDVDASNQAFLPSSSTTVNIVDLTNASKTTATVGRNTEGTAYDSTRDVMWIANYNDNTVTALNAVDGSYAFCAGPVKCASGTLGDSTFATGTRPLYMLYDSVNDNVWISNYLGYTVTVLDASDGSAVATLDTGESWEYHKPMDLAYDPVNDSVWVMTNGNEQRMNVIEFDAATPAFKTGTLATSRYDYPMTAYGGTKMIYDSDETALWFIQYRQGEGLHFISKMSIAAGADHGVVLGDYQVAALSNDVRMSSAGDIWVSSGDWFGEEYDSGYMKIDPLTGEMQDFYQAGLDPGQFILDGNNDIWGYDDDTGTFDHWVENGVPYDYYYTVTSNAAGQIDVSGEGAINSVDIDETLNGANIYYSVSFDDSDTFKAWGSWRPIASNKESIHGHAGDDGIWYWRDNDDPGTWTAAVPNDKNAAISAAVAAGANNQMSGTDLEGLSSSDWATSGGFEAGTTTSLNLAATLYSDDPRTSPELESVDFSFGSSGSSSSGEAATIQPIDPNVTINDNATCAAQSAVKLQVSAKQATEVLISNNSEFLNATWQDFDGVGDAQAMTVDWTLSEGDGEKIVYVQFRSRTDNLSEVVTGSIILDQTGTCAEISEPEVPLEETATYGCMNIEQEPISAQERTEYKFGISPKSGKLSTYDMVRPGDAIRSETETTVYCLDENLKRYQFVDEVTYFTHFRSFASVRWVENSVIDRLEFKGNVLPNMGSVLLKFHDSPRVYYFNLNEDKTTGQLAWIVSEELATELIGADWSDYVIDLNPRLRDLFAEVEPIEETTQLDTGLLRRRQFLNEQSAQIENQAELRMMMLKIKRAFIEGAYSQFSKQQPL